MFFNRKKNRPKEKISFLRNNDNLLEELKEKGISDKNILNAIKKVPRELFILSSFATVFSRFLSFSVPLNK